MSTVDAIPIPEAPVDSAALGQLGLLKLAERALRQIGGDAVRLKLHGGRDIVLLAAPAHAAFWQDHPEVFEKASLRPDTGAGLTRGVLGHTLLTAPEGPDWKVMRHQLTTLLSQAKPWFQRPLAVASERLAASLTGDSDAPLLDLCVAWSMRAICDPIVGNAALDRAAHDIVLGLNDGFIAGLEGRPQPDGLQQDYRVMLGRIARECGRDSIAAQVVEQSASHGEAATEAALRSVVGGMLAGSLHINALSLYWLLVQLADNPDLQDALAAEGAQITAPGRAVDTPLAFAAVRESQRLRPAMAFIERQVRLSCQIGPHTLQPGETVLFSPWFAQRDARAWADPLRFDPTRFLSGARPERGSNLPFGLGPRQCPGANLVNQQLTFALSSLCRAGRLSLGAGTRPGDLAALFRVNLEPRGPVRMVLTPRPSPSRLQLNPTTLVPMENAHAC